MQFLPQKNNNILGKIYFKKIENLESCLKEYNQLLKKNLYFLKSEQSF